METEEIGSVSRKRYEQLVAALRDVAEWVDEPP